MVRPSINLSALTVGQSDYRFLVVFLLNCLCLKHIKVLIKIGILMNNSLSENLETTNYGFGWNGAKIDGGVLCNSIQFFIRVLKVT